MHGRQCDSSKKVASKMRLKKDDSRTNAIGHSNALVPAYEVLNEQGRVRLRLQVLPLPPSSDHSLKSKYSFDTYALLTANSPVGVPPADNPRNRAVRTEQMPNVICSPYFLYRYCSSPLTGQLPSSIPAHHELLYLQYVS
eukprot:GHVS01003461.1.p2 GENE.GHVS01003461.1~~GHVS01003461.1.p2  ORF type:complete len:140 (+),score=17.59 GHVS01003461.1:129-548(+)